ncbi:MAG: hypothetical protein ACR2M0_08235 [Chloroflexia bacterium]
MIPIGVLEPLLPLIHAFARLGIEYQIGGSVASSFWGLARSTRDADIVADIQHHHVAPLVAELQGQYYIDDQMIRDAIRHCTSFNVVYLETMFKVDVFTRTRTAFDDATFQRARHQVLPGAHNEEVVLTSPEDILLHKLVWYREGNEVSERQWLDVLGLIKALGTRLDVGYSREWADRLGVLDLLDRADQAAGAEPQHPE